VDLDLGVLPDDTPDEDLLALDEALQRLERDDPISVNLVKLRFFAGLGQGEAAEALGLPRRTADRHWAFARAWLYDRLRREE
jgi:DNA-directed RNA polymerase specialized sigma24 family protein